MNKAQKSEINAVAQATGQVLSTTALRTNPIAAFIGALIGPIVRLFTGRTATKTHEVRQNRTPTETNVGTTLELGRKNVGTRPRKKRVRTAPCAVSAQALTVNVNNGGTNHA
jgi:hypothetical protein